eukprot:3102525-Rhodomonas_salina.2
MVLRSSLVWTPPCELLGYAPTIRYAMSSTGIRCAEALGLLCDVRGEHELDAGSSLRCAYAMSGTAVAYQAMLLRCAYAMSGTAMLYGAMLLHVSYAMSIGYVLRCGTDTGRAATHWLRGVQY